MITGKTIALTIQTFVGRVTSLLFNILSSFSSEEQASFNFMAAVTVCSDFGAQENGYQKVVSYRKWSRVSSLDHL